MTAVPLTSEKWIGLGELDRNGGLKFRVALGESLQLRVELLNGTLKEFGGS